MMTNEIEDDLSYYRSKCLFRCRRYREMIREGHPGRDGLTIRDALRWEQQRLLGFRRQRVSGQAQPC